MRQFLSEQFTATFSHELAMRLAAPKQCIERQPTNREYRTGWIVSGFLPLKAHDENGQTSVEIDITVSKGWLQTPPSVKPLAAFVRREVDWHVYPDGSLCYVLIAEWCDRLGNLLETHDEDITLALDFASTWLLAATDSLVTRHLLGARHGIKEWPQEWRAYAHGDEGVREYLKARRAKQSANARKHD